MGKFEAKNLSQRFARRMPGAVTIDDGTDGRARRFKCPVGEGSENRGRMVASLHKGLWLHVHRRRQPDGVWLPDLAEESDDARGAVFPSLFPVQDSYRGLPFVHGHGETGGLSNGGAVGRFLLTGGRSQFNSDR